jgi:predicted secreted acid phosphatase
VKHIETPTWIAWIAATATAAIAGAFTVLAYAHANFTTKNELEMSDRALTRQLQIIHQDILELKREVRKTRD